MDWDDKHYYDAQEEARWAAMEAEFQEGLKSLSKEAAKSYLGRYGDAIDARITACMNECEGLLGAGHSGPALALAATAIELMIRFLLLRPLVQGAFLSDEWAAILTERIATGRSLEDRKLLPAVLKQWAIDLATVRTSAGIAVWDFILNSLWPTRNRFAHQYDAVSTADAKVAFECARLFRSDVVDAVALNLGFTLAATGKWCEIRGRTITPTGISYSIDEDFDPGDPFVPRGVGTGGG